MFTFNIINKLKHSIMRNSLLALAGTALLLININANAQNTRTGYGEQQFPNCEWLNEMQPCHNAQVNTIPGRNGGTGTESDPYIVSSAADLAEIANCLNNGTEATSAIFPNGNTGYTDQYFLMDADIDLTEFVPWTPISIPGEKIFFGHFNGGDHTITHMITSAEETHQGLFAVIGAGASVNNLTIKDSRIEGMMYTGAFVGAAGEDSYIYNCHNYSDVIGGYYYIGGITGASWGTIQACTNNGNISTPTDFVGGIVGDFYGTLTECANTGDISGETSVGGLIGYSADADISLGLNAGNIYAGSAYTGGCVGFVTNYGTEHLTGLLVNVGNNYGQYVKAVIGRLWKEGEEESHVYDCFYDCQMTDKTGVNPGNDVVGVVEPRYTHELLGDQLASLLSYSWEYAEGMYPIPFVISKDDIAVVAATPALLRYKTENDFDRFNDIKDDFDICMQNNVVWSSGNGLVEFNNAVGTLIGTGNDTITVSLGEATGEYAYKTINIEIVDMLDVNEHDFDRQNAINVYPNPTSNLIFIEAEVGTEANLYTMDGKLVTSTSQGIINVSNTKSGNYTLVLTKDSMIVGRQKVVVSK